MTRPNWLVIVFLLVCGVTGLRLVYATPMGQVADEPAHIARAAALTRGIVIGRKVQFNVGKVAGVMVDQGLIDASGAELVPPGFNVHIPPAQRKAARAIRWANRLGFDGASGSVEYLPVFYIPGSLGIGIGHWIGQSPLQALYTGRLFMLLGFLLMGALALQRAQFGRPLLFAFLALPMTLSLGASFNQDGMLIAACVLCAALLTETEERAPTARWIAAAIFAAVICSKPPYGFLLFCALIPLRWRGLGRRFMLLSLFAIPSIIWVLVMLRTSFTPSWGPHYHPGPLWPGKASDVFTAPNAVANVRVLMAHPRQIILMPYHYITLYFTGLTHQFFGIFGWLTILMSDQVYHFWELALAAAALASLAGSNAAARPWRLVDALWILGLAVVTVALMELSLYISWTHVGATIIAGVQGRYFLEIVPFLALALPRWGRWINRVSRWRYAALSLETVLTLPVVAIAIYDGFYLPHLIYARFS
ncbi:MAG: DUF2142 domain-containing protein [Acidiphilium sp.]